jgi:hypothetical protein
MEQFFLNLLFLVHVCSYLAKILDEHWDDFRYDLGSVLDMRINIICQALC